MLWGRVVAGLGLCLAGLLLTGCHVQGTVDVISKDQVSLDLIASGDELFCGQWTDLPTLSFQPDPSQANACHITGRTTLNHFADAQSTFMDLGEYRLMETTFLGDHSEWPTGELILRFPGDVVTSNQGRVAGNTVTLTDLPALDNHLKIAFISRPGPPNTVLAAGGGALAGVLGTLVVVGLVGLLRRRRRAPTADLGSPPEPEAERELAPEHASSPEPEPEPPPDPIPGHAPDAVDPPPDSSVWAPPDRD